MGEKLIVWDPDNERSVAKAEAEFYALQTAGFVLLDESGDRPVAVAMFNPKLGRVLATMTFEAEMREEAPEAEVEDDGEDG